MEERFASVDYFAVLGVPSSAGDDEIRVAFRKLALVHHPDKATYDKDEAKRKFQGIAEAYEVLRDAELRARYLRVRSGSGRSRPRPDEGTASRSSRTSRSSGTGSGSIASLRRGHMNAMRQQEREAQAEKEREFAAQQREEQRRYDELKGSIRQHLLIDSSGPEADATWKEWWAQQVGSKWLNASWEQHLPGHTGSDSMQEMLLRDVRKDLQDEKDRERRAEAAAAAKEASAPGGGYSATGALEIPVASHSAPRGKQKARGPGAAQNEASEFAQPAPWQAQPKAPPGKYTGKIGYLDLITILSSLGYAANEAEGAARRCETVEDAEKWIISRNG